MTDHVVVYHDPTRWAATPANNGGNGPTWQWGDELLIGFTRGTFLQAESGHQCTYDQPFEAHLARSTDGGESWTTWQPSGYAGNLNPAQPQPLRSGLDFSGEGFVLRAEGAGYHGNRAARWFHSDDRGASWHGPHAFTGLLDHPELAGKEFTARTAWSFLSEITRTEVGNEWNGNPPALVHMSDGRLCAVYGNRTDRQMQARYSGDDGATWSAPQVLRDGFRSANGFPDLGYARLFQRPDGRLVTTYFWCTAEQPQTHIAATIFRSPER